MVDYSDLVKVSIMPKMEQTASFLAEIRLLYEYPRKGYGKYQIESHLKNLENGYLAELAFLKLITDRIKGKYRQQIIELNQEYSEDKAKVLFDSINNEKFAYMLVIGQPDEGYDFKIKQFLIDIKTYGTDYIISKENRYFTQNKKNEILELNLLIDARQGKKWENNSEIIFIQSFIELDSQNKKKENVIFAGYHKGLPKYNDKFPNPAYACKVRELNTMNDLFNLIGV